MLVLLTKSRPPLEIAAEKQLFRAFMEFFSHTLSDQESIFSSDTVMALRTFDLDAHNFHAAIQLALQGPLIDRGGNRDASMLSLLHPHHLYRYRLTTRQRLVMYFEYYDELKKESGPLSRAAPATRAQIMLALGDISFEIGDYDVATSFFRKCIALCCDSEASTELRDSMSRHAQRIADLNVRIVLLMFPASPSVCSDLSGNYLAYAYRRLGNLIMFSALRSQGGGAGRDPSAFYPQAASSSPDLPATDLSKFSLVDAVTQFEKARTLYAALQDQIGMARVLNELALAFKAVNVFHNFETAVNFLEQSAKIFETAIDTTGQPHKQQKLRIEFTSILSNLGMMCECLDEWQKAITVYERAKDLCLQCHNAELLGVILLGIHFSSSCSSSPPSGSSHF